MNSEDSMTSDLHTLLINLTDEKNLKRSDKLLLYQILAYIIHGKI